MTDALLIEHDGPVDHVTLNRPDRLNALNGELVDGLVAYFESLYRTPGTRIVVLKAAGRAFCAGLDMAPGEGPGSDLNHTGPRLALAVQERISDIYRAMRKCPQPIISLVQGAACGGGFSLALASDIRIAADTARMNAAYIKIGLTGCDMGSSYFLPRLVGASMAAEIILTGRFVLAEEALAMKLVSKVVPEADLEAAATPLIEDMLATAPMGLRLSKQALNMSIDAPSLESALAMEDRQQALLSGTDDAREAIAAFLEKRAPNYKDG
ncbi:MAG: enoyl-CoA hydratase-related protein [Pseudomonadota bacterium]